MKAQTSTACFNTESTCSALRSSGEGDQAESGALNCSRMLKSGTKKAPPAGTQKEIFGRTCKLYNVLATFISFGCT